MSKRRIVVFCGGSGASCLVQTLSRDDSVALSILVNCYDDGLSTGKLRASIPGMLGPSDVRKNVAHARRRASAAALEHVLRFRFPVDGPPAAHIFDTLGKPGALGGDLPREKIRPMREAVGRFLTYLRTHGIDFSYEDVSLGNIVFAGLYLEDRDFNGAVRRFSRLFEAAAEVLNVTDGTDLKLLGITRDNCILQDEYAVSCCCAREEIADVFLWERYPRAEELEASKSAGFAENLAWLSTRSRTPRPNAEALAAIERADLILYWPGTLHSSLFPGFLTEGVAEAVVKSRAGRKVWVMNILRDHDIRHETAYSLIEKFFRFMSRKGRAPIDPGSVVTDILLNRGDFAVDTRLLPLGEPRRSYPGVSVHVDDWSDLEYRHAVKKILDFARSLGA